jgi:hypothetical protein
MHKLEDGIDGVGRQITDRSDTIVPTTDTGSQGSTTHIALEEGKFSSSAKARAWDVERGESPIELPSPGLIAVHTSINVSSQRRRSDQESDTSTVAPSLPVHNPMEAEFVR